MNANKPKAIIIRVSSLKNASAVIFKDIVSPNRIDTRFTNSFCAD